MHRRTVRKLLLAVVALVALVALAGSAGAGSRTLRYVLPGDAVFPEGVAHHPNTFRFYVSSTTDGTIFRGDLRRTQTSVFLPGGEDGRTTAIGLKADTRRLYVAGGPTGRIFVYDTRTQQLVRRFETGTGGFINDVTVAIGGDSYYTDSLRPVIYRVPASDVRRGTETPTPLLPWLNLTGTPIQFTTGFNLNGIVATPTGRYLLTVQANTGRIYRIDTTSQEIVEIDLGGTRLTGGDGLVLRGLTLYVVRGSAAEVAVVRLSPELDRGRVLESIKDPSFAFPTTAALALKGVLLVVNSQFDKRAPGQSPVLPFTVSGISAR